MLDPSDAAWELIASATARPVVLASSNGARPAGPHADLNFLANRPVGDDVLGPLDAEGIGTRRGQRAMTAVVTFYGATALADAQALWLALSRARLVEKAETLNLGIGARIALRDESALLDNAKWEARAACEFELLWLASGPDTVGLVEEVEIEGGTTGGALPGEHIETVTIEGG